MKKLSILIVIIAIAIAGFYYWWNIPRFEHDKQQLALRQKCESSGGIFNACGYCPRGALCGVCNTPCTCPKPKVWDPGMGCTEEYDVSGKACSSDSDCTCRGFTGAKFLDGAVPSRCNQETKTCIVCYYE